jgi:hypothetical protein
VAHAKVIFQNYGKSHGYKVKEFGSKRKALLPGMHTSNTMYVTTHNPKVMSKVNIFDKVYNLGQTPKQRLL